MKHYSSLSYLLPTFHGFMDSVIELTLIDLPLVLLCPVIFTFKNAH